MKHFLRLFCALAAASLLAAATLSTAVLSSDRGYARDPGATLKGSPATGDTALAAATPTPAAITVNSLSDGAANDGLCTLREAITSANTRAASGAAAGECAAGGASNSITFSPALTAGGAATISLLSPLPDINNNVTISGPGPNLLTITRSSNAAAVTDFSLVVVETGQTVTLSGLTLSGGQSRNGGGVNNVGTLTIDNCAITGNNAHAGGGISNSTTLTIYNSTISNNVTDDFGGGINSNGPLTVINSTISGNRTDLHGGGIKTGGSTLTVVNSTITNNRADFNDDNVGGGGGISTFQSVTTLRNTIVAGNFRRQAAPVRDDVDGFVNASSSHNLIGDGTGMDGLSGGSNGNSVGNSTSPIDPRLGPLADNGGPTETHALLSGSPALDAGDNSLALDAGNNPLATDQRGAGFPRVVNSAVDIGAFESQTLVVNSLADADDGNCTAAGTGNGCTLREAINALNSHSSSAATIAFDASLTSGGPATINLAGALPGINADMTISGPGANLLTVRRDTGGDYRIFTISNTATVNISGLTISNGRTPGGSVGPALDAVEDNGGGVLNKGMLALSSCVVSDNSAPSTAHGGYSGGGVANWTGATLTVTGCTISNNSTGFGGGLSNGGTLTVTDSVVSGNTAVVCGGIISNAGTLSVAGSNVIDNSSTSDVGGIGGFSGGTVNITNSTVSNNSAGNSGGGLSSDGALSVTGSTVSNNTAGFGGGLFNSGTLTLTDSTVSGNAANGDPLTSGFGGGIHNIGTLTLTNSTAADNSASNSGGGLYNGNTQSTLAVRFANSIFAGNTASSGPDLSGVFTSQGHNLVGNDSGATITAANGDQLGTPASPIDPRLGPLADNGGPTRTHALLAGSPALDAGDNSLAVDASNKALTTDQRGLPRRADSADAGTTQTVDIGAFEAGVSVEDITDKATNEDTPLSFSFNVGDAALGLSSVAATSSNTSLVPNDAGHVGLTGTGSARTLTLTPLANLSGTSTITVTATGTNGRSMSDTFLLTVNPVNDAPTLDALGDLTIDEDAGTLTVSLSGITAGSNETQNLTVTATSGDTSVIPNPSVSYTSPAATGSISFAPAADKNGGPVRVTVTVRDDGGTANGGTDTFSRAFNVTVNAVNDAPVNTVPGAQTTAENAPLVFSAAHSNAVSVADVDAGTDPVKVTLSSTCGTLTLGSTAGLTFTAGDGNDDATMTFAAPVAAVNTALNGLTFKPDRGFSGAASLQVVTDDQGHNGAGGAKSDTDSVTISVLAGGTLQLSADAFEAGEGAGVVAFKVARAGGSAGAASVNFSTSTGTATGGSSCAPGVDFVNNSGTLNWADGDAADKTFTVTICDDSAHEPDETAGLSLSGAAGSASPGTPSSATLTIKDDDPAGGRIEFAQAVYNVSERGGSVTVEVKRTGDTTRPAAVDYATDDGSTPSVAVPCSAVTGLALERCDYTRAAGTLQFAAGETEKTFIVPVNDDSYSEGTETAALRLSNPSGGAVLGGQATATLQITDDQPGSTGNPSDDPSFFVRQHYHDFLNREPDQSGLQFWTGGINACGSDANCAAVKRVNTSAAFFLSIEFQDTGYLVEKIYKTAYGDATGQSTFPVPHQLPVPVVRLTEFLRDTQEIGSTPAQVIVGQGNWQQQLEDNKNAFALEFVQRQRFADAFPPSLTADRFVRQLDANAGGVLSEADITQLDALFGGPSSPSDDASERAQALRQVAENPLLNAAEKNRAFVLMQFFGYLRRNPNDAQDTDYTGYDFWLSKLNQFSGDFVKAEMVKAFLSSIEYRQRFGQ
jgi:CSLREA domain-containing protein